jgi:hypothetical protein
LRAGYINALEACPARCLDNIVFKSEKGQLFSLVSGSTNSKLFTMFMKGCEKRMGRLVKQDLGISFDMLMEVLRVYEEELMDINISDKCKWFIVVCSGAFVILWAGALRGGEIFMLEASEFARRRDDGRDREEDGHVIVPLMGRFKNETVERNLLIVLANRTKGGLDIRRCVDWFTSILLREGKGSNTGPAVCNEDRGAYGTMVFE